jgi:hypothetical protein
MDSKSLMLIKTLYYLIELRVLFLSWLRDLKVMMTKVKTLRRKVMKRQLQLSKIRSL